MVIDKKTLKRKKLKAKVTKKYVMKRGRLKEKTTYL